MGLCYFFFQIVQTIPYVDIISFDLSWSLNNKLPRKILSMAVQKDIFFEVSSY